MSTSTMFQGRFSKAFSVEGSKLAKKATMLAIPQYRRRGNPAPTLLHRQKVQPLEVHVSRRASVPQTMWRYLEVLQIQCFYGRGKHLLEFGQGQREKQGVVVVCPLRGCAKQRAKPTTI